MSGRSDLSWDEAVRLDLYYVDNWSLTYDLGILWRTIWVVLQAQGRVLAPVPAERSTVAVRMRAWLV